MNLYVLNALENCHAILWIATHYIIKFIILIGRKYFSNYVAQSNYWIIQAKLLNTLFKSNIETNEYSKFIKTQKWFLWLKFKNIVRIKRYAEKTCSLNKKLSMRLISKGDLG